jgi:hypothetical protein
MVDVHRLAGPAGDPACSPSVPWSQPAAKRVRRPRARRYSSSSSTQSIVRLTALRHLR